ncbi:hypothetical protein BU16DRAFT_63396 [Lophium mytilinum]|uniref:Uncharacterized protein n=1 Tax=Lophium mytilinum TaxID=390894 RepID=A0A6A6QPI0_9PEZI|nr:hypothetical protein BU16DRAFT_63396 [Lophium mytilinum]
MVALRYGVHWSTLPIASPWTFCLPGHITVATYLPFSSSSFISNTDTTITILFSTPTFIPILLFHFHVADHLRSHLGRGIKYHIDIGYILPIHFITAHLPNSGQQFFPLGHRRLQGRQPCFSVFLAVPFLSLVAWAHWHRCFMVLRNLGIFGFYLLCVVTGFKVHGAFFERHVSESLAVHAAAKLLCICV